MIARAYVFAALRRTRRLFQPSPLAIADTAGLGARLAKHGMKLNKRTRHIIGTKMQFVAPVFISRLNMKLVKKEHTKICFEAYKINNEYYERFLNEKAQMECEY